MFKATDIIWNYVDLLKIMSLGRVHILFTKKACITTVKVSNG